MPAFSLFSFTFIRRLFSFTFFFCHKGSVICISEVIDITLGSLDSSQCFIQPDISHDVLCIEVKSAGWQYTALSYSFPNLERIHCSMSGSNCCFLTIIQISQETGKMIWYFLLFKNFLQLVVIQKIKVFSIVNEAEVDFFPEILLLFSMIQWIRAIWFLFPLSFLIQLEDLEVLGSHTGDT